jgi:hypothetical protein
MGARGAVLAPRHVSVALDGDRAVQTATFVVHG